MWKTDERRARRALLLLLIPLVPLTAAPAFGLSEDEVLAALDARLPDLAALEARADEAQKAAALAGTLAPPALSLSREDAADATDTFLTLSQKLPLWGQRRLRREAATEEASAVSHEVARQRTLLRGSARQLFAALLAAQERCAALERALAVAREIERVLDERVAAGDAAHFELARARAAIATLERSHALRDAERAESAARLVRLLQPAADAASLVAEGTLAPAASLPPLGPTLERALAERSDGLAARARRAAAGTRHREARRAFLPQPEFELGWKRAESAAFEDDGYVLGVNLALPIGGRHRASLALAESRKTRLSLAEQALERRIAAEVEAAHAALSSLHASWSRRAESDALTPTARVLYDEGETPILTLFDAIDTDLAQDLDDIELRHALRVAEIRLALAAGKERLP